MQDLYDQSYSGGGLVVSDSVRLMRVVWGFPVQVSEVGFLGFRV